MSVLAGFCAAAEENGCEYRENWIKHTDGTLQSGRAAALELLTAPDRPDAVVCSSNLLAFAFAEAAHELGVIIPDGVQLITFDRYPYSPLIVPEPTLVQIDVRDMGRVAAKQLLQELKKPELRVQSFYHPAEPDCRKKHPPDLTSARKGALLYIVTMYVRLTSRVPEHPGCFASLRSLQGQNPCTETNYLSCVFLMFL